MISVMFLSKIGVHEIQIHGVTLKVRVLVAHATDDPTVDIGISELRSQFGTTVVGLMLQPDQNSNYLQLCVGTRCLMYEIPTAWYQIMPESLIDFLSNSKICFVGVSDLTNSHVSCKNYVKLSELGARVLKKPSLSSCSLEALANEVGINLEERSSGVNVDWKAKAFSDDEIKCATREVCACYLIGNKLLGPL